MSNGGWHGLGLGMGLEEAGVGFGREWGFYGLASISETWGPGAQGHLWIRALCTNEALTISDQPE